MKRKKNILKYIGKWQTGLPGPAWSWKGWCDMALAAEAEPAGHQPPMLIVAFEVNLVCIIKYILYFLFLLLGNVLPTKVNDSMLIRSSKRKISLHFEEVINWRWLSTFWISMYLLHLSFQSGTDPRGLCVCYLGLWVHRWIGNIYLEGLVFFVCSVTFGSYIISASCSPGVTKNSGKVFDRDISFRTECPRVSHILLNVWQCFCILSSLMMADLGSNLWV